MLREIRVQGVLSLEIGFESANSETHKTDDSPPPPTTAQPRSLSGKRVFGINIGLFLCVYISIYVYIQPDIYKYTHMCIFIYVCMYGWMVGCMCVYVYVYILHRQACSAYCIPVGEYICMCIFLYTYR